MLNRLGLLRILTLLEKATREGKDASTRRRGHAPASAWRATQKKLDSSAVHVPFSCCVLFFVDRGHGGMRAGHEDFGDSMAAYMDSGKAQTYLEGRSLLFVASLVAAAV